MRIWLAGALAAGLALFALVRHFRAEGEHQRRVQTVVEDRRERQRRAELEESKRAQADQIEQLKRVQSDDLARVRAEAEAARAEQQRRAEDEAYSARQSAHQDARASCLANCEAQYGTCMSGCAPLSEGGLFGASPAGACRSRCYDGNDGCKEHCP
jgi:hypothetical protein